MQWSIGKKLGAGFGIILLLFVVVNFLSYQKISQSIETTGQVQHSWEVHTQIV
jgi:CHASE3 domain sensor protein